MIKESQDRESDSDSVDALRLLDALSSYDSTLQHISKRSGLRAMAMNDS